MSDSDHPGKFVEPAWDRGWEEHAEAQRRRIADLPLWVRIDWLEETQRMLAGLRRTPPDGGASREP
jgi:hypothetical protein